MSFGKRYPALRIFLMMAFFVTGLTLVLLGWKMTGQLAGLGLMLLGIVFLLITLFLYNERYR